MIIWDWYGNITYLSSDLYYGKYVELYKIRSNPIETSESTCGIGMGLSHVIPIPDPMGNIWNFMKYVAIP